MPLQESVSAVGAHNWTIDPGKFVIRVGDSSEDTPLNAEIALK